MDCLACAEDLRVLRRIASPAFGARWPVLRVVDLFCGCGGMSIGFAEAASELKRRLHVALAVDDNPTAADTFLRNFPRADVRTAKIEELLDGELGGPLTRAEQDLVNEVGQVSILAGGPPCQGHSDLNNRTRRDDPRNRLYARMARAGEVLHPQVLAVENVPSVANDRGAVVQLTSAALESAGYRVHAATVDLRRVGVPQRRRRHLLLALRPSIPLSPIDVFQALAGSCDDHVRSVGWAISDLEDIEPMTDFDRPGVPSPDNRRRIEKLFGDDLYDLDNADRPSCHHDDAHTYRSMYGRLRWDEPAQTITTGFGSMGQGRYVHPSRPRTLTPHEAARLQTLPDYVQLGLDETRGAWARMIGNAVPPFLTRALGRTLIPHIAPAFPDGRARRCRQPQARDKAAVAS